MSYLIRLVVSAIAALVLTAPVTAFADDAPAEASGAYSRDALEREGFVPVAPGQGETVDGGRLLVIAYAVIWLLVLGYVFMLARRQNQVAGELDQLRKRLAEVDDDIGRLESRSTK